MQANAGLGSTFTNQGDRLPTANLFTLPNQGLSQVGIERTHIMAMVNLYRKSETAMLANLDYRPCTRRIDGIAFYSHIVNAPMGQFAIRKGVVDHFKTLFDGVIIFHRMQHWNLFGKRRITFQGGKQLLERTLNFVYTLAFLQN